ncbi:hypothetical protein [Bacteroides sp.]|uniref:hypothetical protein n=1 Tax=Bacteroides sp. TaxID=29523 RepID=UPI0026164CA7|nr:hypothetical protein [Bacteroides sp.]
MTNTFLQPLSNWFSQPCFTLWNLIGFFILLLIIAGYCLLLVKNKKLCLNIRNRVLIPVTALGGFFIYFIGYMDEGSLHSLIALGLRSFISTFHMFFLHSDLIEVSKHMHESVIYMTLFSIIHFLAFLITFMIVIQLFGKHLLSWLKLRYASAETNYIFFGLNEESLELAKSLLKRKEENRQILLLDKRIKNKLDIASKSKILESVFQNRESLFEQVSKLDVLLLNREYTQEDSLKDIGIAKLLTQGKVHLFFFSNNIDYNIQSALNAIDEIQNQLKSTASISIYVRANADYMINLFEKKSSENIDIHIINPAKLAAMELIINYPPVNYVEVDTQKAIAKKDFTALIIGLGEVGHYTLRVLTEHGQFVKSAFHAIAIDKDMDSKQGEFEYRFPGMKHYDIEYKKLLVNSNEYWELLDKKSDTLDYIVISLGDSNLNMKTAISICRFMERKTDRSIDIFVKVHNSADYDYMKVATEKFKAIKVFGSNEGIFTEDIIVDESRYMAARKIHDYYNNKKDPSRQASWKDLSHIKKVTNISAAIHLQTKLKMMGLEKEEIKQLICENDFLAQLGNERLDNLAEGEHLHWNATLFTNEWDTWKPDSSEHFTNKDERRKLHACLVDWKDLKEVEKIFGEPYQEYDYDSVKKIWSLIKDDIVK